jgi:hypothetical protein
MEKYARQSLSEGVKNAEELRVGNDSELLRVLNLHYNRNNHIDVSHRAFNYTIFNAINSSHAITNYLFAKMNQR